MASKNMMRDFARLSKNLNKEVSAIRGRTMKGLIRAVVIVRRSMDKTSPKIPVDFGNLRASFFSVTSTGATKAGKSPNFKGTDASKLSADHSTTIAMHQAEAQGHGKNNPVVIFGFSAEYAHWVHENVGGNIQWGREGAGPKFFEAHLKSNKAAMLAVIAEETKIR